MLQINLKYNFEKIAISRLVGLDVQNLLLSYILI